MQRAGVGFAILHGFTSRGEPDSDIDVVVDRDPREVLALARPEWAAAGLRPIMYWPYDLGGTAAIFLTTPDATSGVQLDLLFDLRGIGKYGVRSAQILATAELDDGWPRVSPLASLIYQLRKRVVKGQPQRAREIAEEIARQPAEEIDRLAVAITGRPVSGNPLASGPRPVRRRPAAVLGRGLQRIRNPVGYWAHCNDEKVAPDLAARFRRVLVDATVKPSPPTPFGALRWSLEVRLSKIRPILIISTGDLIGGQTPDLVVDHSELDQAAAAITRGMDARLV